MRRLAGVVVALAAALATGTARAHETGGRAMGVVQSVSPDRLAVRASDGHEVVFAVTPETRFLRGKQPARAGDVRVGQRVVVHGKKAGGALQALEVKLGAAPAAR